jgi:DNA-binding transcriptional LysR family regulator
VSWTTGLKGLPRLLDLLIAAAESEFRIERALVEVLAGFPPSPLPIHVLYSHTRQLSPRLRVFIDWMAEQFRDRHSPTE